LTDIMSGGGGRADVVVLQWFWGKRYYPLTHRGGGKRRKNGNTYRLTGSRRERKRLLSFTAREAGKKGKSLKCLSRGGKRGGKGGIHRSHFCSGEKVPHILPRGKLAPL